MCLIGQTKNRGFLDPVKTYWGLLTKFVIHLLLTKYNKKNEKATLSIVYRHNFFQRIVLFLKLSFRTFL